MSDKPRALVAIDDLAANIRSTMLRASDVFPPSMRLQVSRAVAQFLRLRLAGEPFMHPGMAKMAKWGQCSERQAKRNVKRLVEWGVLVPVAYPRGGRRATRFVIRFDQLKMLLVEMGAGCSAALSEKLAWAARNSDRNSDIRAEENSDIGHDTMSPGIHTLGETHPEGWAAVVTHSGRPGNA